MNYLLSTYLLFGLTKFFSKLGIRAQLLPCFTRLWLYFVLDYLLDFMLHYMLDYLLVYILKYMLDYILDHILDYILDFIGWI